MVGAIGSSPLFAAAQNQFACQVLAGAAERAGSSSCSTTDSWSLELDGGPGGSDVAWALRRYVDRLEGSEPGNYAESSDWTCTLSTWWDIICKSKLARSREMRMNLRVQ